MAFVPRVSFLFPHYRERVSTSKKKSLLASCYLINRTQKFGFFFRILRECFIVKRSVQNLEHNETAQDILMKRPILRWVDQC